MSGEVQPEPSTATLVMLGDWFAPHRPEFWLGELIEVAESVGVNPRSTRTVAQRFARDGWFDVERIGRQSRYSLTERGRLELHRGDLRILRRNGARCAAPWTVVSIGVPDTDAKLVKELSWLGFAELRRNVWIGPFAPDDGLDNVLAGVECDVFENARFESDSDLVARCWDLEAAELRYEKFLELVTGQATPHDPGDAFRQRFWINYLFLLALRIDPELPESMMSSNWAGVRARRLFEARRGQLEQPAAAYLREIAARYDSG